MKLIQYVTAHVALMTLMKKEFPYAVAYKLVELKRRIAPKVEFYAEEEGKLVREYAKCNDKGKPDIKGDSFECKGDTPEEISANVKAYEQKKRELCAVEDEEDKTKIKIKLPENVCITPEVIEALDAFVEFEVSV